MPNGQFTAVGASGMVVTSPDGRPGRGGVAGGLQRGAAGRDLRERAIPCGGGERGDFFSSPTGATWTQQTSGVPQLLYDAAFGAGNFSVSGGVRLVLTSSNGTQWSSNNVLNPSTAWFERVILGRRFLWGGSAGNVQVSPTGGVWTQQATGTSNELMGIAEGDNVYVAVGRTGSF